MEIKSNLAIKTSPQIVFNALSTDKGIKGWWSKSSIIGEKEDKLTLLKFDKNNDGNIIDMLFRTTELVTNKKVVWECIENGNPAWIGTKIIFEISGHKNETELNFSHSDFDEKWNGKEPFEMTKGGWLGHFLPSLVSFCETGNGQPM
jgi:uncharacterized protein YndB with AHSA1/START domain